MVEPWRPRLQGHSRWNGLLQRCGVTKDRCNCAAGATTLKRSGLLDAARAPSQQGRKASEDLCSRESRRSQEKPSAGCAMGMFRIQSAIRESGVFAIAPTLTANATHAGAIAGNAFDGRRPGAFDFWQRNATLADSGSFRLSSARTYRLRSNGNQRERSRQALQVGPGQPR
jgi:hypothetical protein